MDDRFINDDWKPVTNFRLVCEKCDKAGKKHHTRIYVDWEIRSYMLACDECDTVEYFDEEGRQIEKDRLEAIIKKEKEDKVLN